MRKKRNKSSIYLIIILSFFIGNIVISQQITAYNQEKELKILKEKEKTLKESIDNSVKLLESIDSNELLENIARNRYKMIKKNEILIRYKKG